MEANAKNLDDAPAIRCVRCGYDLRGHDESAKCPECGLDAYWSIRAPANLAQYPPRWVRWMSWATRLLALAYAIAFLSIVLSFYGLWSSSEIVTTAVLALAAVPQMVGAWLLTRQSGYGVERPAPIMGWALRFVSTAAVAGGVVGLFMLRDYNMTLLKITIALGCIGATSPFLAFARISSVARLIAKPILAEHSRIVSWGFFAVAISILPVGYVSDWLAGQHHSTIANFVAVPLVILLLLFLAWGAFIMWRCVVDFGRAAKVAGDGWNANTPAL